MRPRGKGRASSLPLANGAGLTARLMGLLSGVAAGEDPGRAEQPKLVLMVDSYGRDIAPWNAITPAFKSELARQLQSPVEFHLTGLRSPRDAESQPALAFAEYLRALYAKDPPYSVLPVGAAATQFWWRHRQFLFPSIPVVSGGIEHRILQAQPLGPNDTAVTVQIEIARATASTLFTNCFRSRRTLRW